MNKTIVHVSEVEIAATSGMGRIELYWKETFEKAGYTFIHIGPTEVGKIRHRGLFALHAYNYFKKLNIKPAAFIVHEPSSGVFVKRGIPCFVESHGIERRYWQAQLNGSVPAAKISLKTKLLFPLWRLRNCDKGLKHATKLLLSSTDDKAFAKLHYNRKEDDILVFKNGVNAVAVSDNGNTDQPFTVLFNATWIERKGIYTLIKAAQQLHQQGLHINYLLIGTGSNAPAILEEWPEALRPFVTIVSRFKQAEENEYLAKASLFVLPSYFEGQPLSLLQAMAAGKCCISTSCCGQKDVIKPGETGFLFEVGNHAELAKLVADCYNNPAITERLGKNARQYAQHLTWEKVSTEIMNCVLERAIK